VRNYCSVFKVKLWMIAFIIPLASCGSDSGGESKVLITEENAIAIAEKSLTSAEFALVSVSAIADLIEALNVVTASQTINCPGGGTETIQLAGINPSSGLNSADILTIVDHGCTDIEHLSVTNGELKVLVGNKNGNVFNGRIIFNNYSVEYNQSDVESIVFDGTTQFNNLRYLDQYMIYDDNTSSSTNKLNITTTSNSTSNTITLKGHKISRELVLNDGDQYEIEFKGTLLSQDIGGQVEISTPSKLYGTLDLTPVVGVIEILGDGGSKVKLIGKDSTYMDIQVEDAAGELLDIESTYEWTDVLKGFLWTF